MKEAAGGARGLFRSCIEGEAGARERFVEAFERVVRGAVAAVLERRGRLTQRELLDDCTQEVFAGLFADGCRKLRQFQGRNACSPASWLRVVSARAAMDLLRRERPAASIEEEHGEGSYGAAAEAGGTPGPEEIAIRNETLARVRSAISALHPRDQLLLRLHLVEGMPIGEAARLLHMSRSLAYVRKSRLLHRLQRLLGETSKGRER